MGTTVNNAAVESHREELAEVRPRPAKADLRPQVRTSCLREVAADAIRSTSGNARAAAIDMNIHEGHLSRQLKDGTLRLEQLEVLGPSFAAKFGQELVERFGEMATPKDYALKRLDEIESALREIRQFIQGIA